MPRHESHARMVSRKTTEERLKELLLEALNHLAVGNGFPSQEVLAEAMEFHCIGRVGQLLREAKKRGLIEKRHISPKTKVTQEGISFIKAMSKGSTRCPLCGGEW